MLPSQKRSNKELRDVLLPHAHRSAALSELLSHESFSGADATLDSKALAVLRRQLAAELRENDAKRFKEKSCSEKARYTCADFLKRYEYGVMLGLAFVVLALHSYFMELVFEQVNNLTDGHFDTLQLNDYSPMVCAGIALFFLTVIVCYMTLHLVSAINGESVGLAHSAQIYFLTIMYFSAVYLFIFCTIEESFKMNSVLFSTLSDFTKCGNRTHRVPCSGWNRMIRMNILWFYFATTTQSSVGFGDISPSDPASQIAVDIQVFLGMVYSVYILGQTVRRITHADTHRSKPTNCLGKFFSALVHNRVLTTLRRLLRRFILVVTVVLQAGLYFTIYVADGADNIFHSNRDVPVGIAVSIIAFNTVQLLVIVFTTTKFVRKTEELDMSFLLQSFGSVCVTMASVYLAIHSLAFHDLPFKIDLSKGNGEQKDFMVIVLQFFHFSLCLMTTTGYGDIFPAKWYSRLVVTAHMLLSVLYIEIMFGLGLRLVRIDARSPTFSMAGPEVIFICAPASCAIRCASVVFPSPGGP